MNKPNYLDQIELRISQLKAEIETLQGVLDFYRHGINNTPQAHADAYQFNEDLKKELLRVLKCSGSIVVTERVGGDLISTQSPSQQT